ncbi:GNAT family N-acetyltransferase [Nocardia yunnanensis]|uniref:GNAT family N-acetyltransferase n=1 Tax=Nocardia yunnanensis TaxID=2382165 RepID=A0A386ZN78_9NOCA|nr:GNAT family N-acetyltransferase [Nocardia yunnanensis]
MEEMVRVLTLAFETDDPIEEYVFPDLAQRRRRTPGMLRVLIRHRYLPAAAAIVAEVDGRVAGTVLWIPAGYRNPVWREAISGPRLLWAMGPAATRRGIEVDAAIAKSAPVEPHNYMVYVAAEPQSQRVGVGRAMMDWLIAETDAQGRALCGLCKDGNVGYYQGFDAQPIDRVRIGSKGPEMNFIKRSARVAAG